MLPFQRAYDDLETPLRDVTFCVVDVETSGTSPVEQGLTEIGAVKLRGGERLGTLSTFVDRGRWGPPSGAPPVPAVLAAFLEFAAGTVLVGHNVRFDLAFLNAALELAGYEPLPHPVVDTCALARRLVRDDVSDCRLATLAWSLRLAHQPTHRALDDALATGDLLHALLERATGYGVLGLDHLLQFTAPKRKRARRIAH